MVFRRKEATRGFFFQSKRRKPCSKQDYQCTFPLAPSPACSALLCSFTTPSLLSVCLSLRQKHSSAECGGMGAQTRSLSPPSLSLTLLTLNCAAQGGKKTLICSRERMHEQLQNLQRILEESEHLYSSPFCQMKQKLLFWGYFIYCFYMHGVGYSIEQGWGGNEKRVCVVARGACVRAGGGGGV